MTLVICSSHSTQYKPFNWSMQLHTAEFAPIY